MNTGGGRELRGWFLAVVMGTTCGGCGLSWVSQPPQQAAFGPGGADYRHASMGMLRVGEGGREAWLFWPEDPTPEHAPVVVFLHGWSGISPKPYSAWIAHLVLKGRIVIYPRYQESILTPFEEMEQNAADGLRVAWKVLQNGGRVYPEEAPVVWIGHSLGGLLTVNLAESSPALGLPPPGALMIVQPGGDEQITVRQRPALPEATNVLVVTAEDDRWVGDAPAERIVDLLSGVLPRERLSHLTVPSDWHSFPFLIADHFAPLAENGRLNAVLNDVTATRAESVRLIEPDGANAVEVTRAPDALDFYGYWKLADGLIDSTSRGVHGEFALQDTAARAFMGRHSDGAPAARLRVREIGE